MDLGLFNVEISSLHSDTPHSVAFPCSSDRPVAETSTCQHTILTINRLPWAIGRRPHARREHRNLVWVEKNHFSPGLQHSGSCRFAGVCSHIALFFLPRQEGLPSVWRWRPAETENICQDLLDVCEKTASIADRKHWRLVCSRHKRRPMEKAVDWLWILWLPLAWLTRVYCTCTIYIYIYIYIHSFIHSLVFSLRGRVGRNQSPVMWPVWLWHTASWASSWG